MEKYVYHFVPKGMVGDTLYPLNQLKELDSILYEKQAAKYKGREHLLEKRIEKLDCLWNDVLHLSPIEPKIIIDIWKRESLKDERLPTNIEYFKIPVSRLDDSKTVTCISTQVNFGAKPESIWDDFCLESYQELKKVPDIQIEIWRDDQKAGRMLFWYSHILHVLTKDTINVKDVERVKVDLK